MYSGIQDSLWENRMKSLMLLVAFPVLLWWLTILAWTLLVMSENALPFAESWQEWLSFALDAYMILWPIIIIWAILSFLLHRQIIFSFTGAVPLTRKENPEIYNIVENLCLSRGLFVPRIGIIEDDSLNAFATGWNSKNAWVVFSRGLINKLNKSEIEAVAAHELTHLINKDSLLMVVIVVFVGVIGMLWQILVRTSGASRDSKKWNPLIVVWIVMMIVGYLIYPLIQLAISRKREFLADAGSVSLTKDKFAMISALEKISQDSRIESIDKANVAAMCIVQPLAVDGKRWFFKNLFSTHPSIESRIEALRSY